MPQSSQDETDRCEMFVKSPGRLSSKTDCCLAVRRSASTHPPLNSIAPRLSIADLAERLSDVTPFGGETEHVAMCLACLP
jgi:hypothetical protein